MKGYATTTAKRLAYDDTMHRKPKRLHAQTIKQTIVPSRVHVQIPLAASHALQMRPLIF